MLSMRHVVYLVEISDYHSVVNGFREAIYSLLNMPEQLEKLSSGALQKQAV